METTINISEKPKLRNPILIEGLPGIGNVGRIAAGYLVSELKMKKFAELYSPHFLPLVVLHDDIAQLLKCEFYYSKGKRDMIVLTGDTQSMTPEGHYEICEKILDFAGGLGVKEVITLGGFAEAGKIKEPKVIGAVNSKGLQKKYGSYGIDFGKEHSIGTIVGASGILLGLSGMRRIDGICLMGQTIGLPFVTDPKAADRVLHVLSEILGLKLDLSKLEGIIKEMEEKIGKTAKIHSRILEDISKPKDEQMRYIG